MPSSQGQEFVDRLLREVEYCVRESVPADSVLRMNIMRSDFAELVNQFEGRYPTPAAPEQLLWDTSHVQLTLRVHTESNGTEYKVSEVVLIKVSGLSKALPAQLTEAGGTGLPMGERPLHWRVLPTLQSRATYIALNKVSSWAKLPESVRSVGDWSSVRTFQRAPQPESVRYLRPRGTSAPQASMPEPSNEARQFYTYSLGGLGQGPAQSAAPTPSGEQLLQQQSRDGRTYYTADFARAEQRLAEEWAAAGTVSDPTGVATPYPSPIDPESLRIGSYADYYPPPTAPISAVDVRRAVDSLREAAPRVQEFYQQFIRPEEIFDLGINTGASNATQSPDEL